VVDVFFAFTAPSGDIGEVYGRISASTLHPGSIVLKDVVTGEVLGHADCMGNNHGCRPFGGDSISGLGDSIDRHSGFSTSSNDLAHSVRRNVGFDGSPLSLNRAMSGQRDGSLPLDPAVVDVHSFADLFLNAHASIFGCTGATAVLAAFYKPIGLGASFGCLLSALFPQHPWSRDAYTR
jgi:hypothetical protein